MGKRGRRSGKSKKSGPDQSEKLLEEWNDVFADIINVIVYGGRRCVREEYLVDGPTASRYKAAEGAYHEKSRDICKEDIRGGVHYAIWGLENQTGINRLMPIRCMEYDYASYEWIAKRIKAKNKLLGKEAGYIGYIEELHKGQKLWPVVTIVLYFGTEEWDGLTTLWELANVPDELRPFVPNYKVNLVQVAFLDEETIEKFQSDFRIIAKFFRAKRLGKEKEMRYNDPKVFDHVAEMMEFLRTFTNDNRYEEYKTHMIEKAKEGEVSMCSLIDEFENQGRQEGLAIGRYVSVDELAKSGNMSIEQAIGLLNFSEKEKAGYSTWVAAGKKTT